MPNRHLSKHYRNNSNIKLEMVFLDKHSVYAKIVIRNTYYDLFDLKIYPYVAN